MSLFGLICCCLSSLFADISCYWLLFVVLLFVAGCCLLFVACCVMDVACCLLVVVVCGSLVVLVACCVYLLVV